LAIQGPGTAPLTTRTLCRHAFCQLYGGDSVRTACQDRVYPAAFPHPRSSAGHPGRGQWAGLFPGWRSDIRVGSRCALTPRATPTPTRLGAVLDLAISVASTTQPAWEQMALFPL